MNNIEHINFHDGERIIEQYFSIYFNNNKDNLSNIINNYSLFKEEKFNDNVSLKFTDNNVLFNINDGTGISTIDCDYKHFLFYVNKECYKIINNDNSIKDKGNIICSLEKLKDTFNEKFNISRTDLLSDISYLNDNEEYVNKDNATLIIIYQYDEFGNYIGNNYMNKTYFK